MAQSDLLPFKHGEEGTHGACVEMFEKYGDKVECCACKKHECKGIEEEDQEIPESPFE